MTEYSHFWGGDHIGAIASDWRVSDDDFAMMLRNVFGLGTPYTWDVGLPAGYSIQTQCGVLKARDNELEVTENSLDIEVDTGVAIVDGRIYNNTAGGLVAGTIVAPGSGTNYYLCGLRAIKASQTVRAVLIGPETDPANIVQPFTPGTDVLEPLAAITIDSGSSVTIYDLRRFIRPMGYQLISLIRRQGDEDSLLWNEPGTDGIILDSEVGIMFGCFQDDYDAAAGHTAEKYLGDVFEYAIGFATHADTDPNVIVSTKFTQDDFDSSNRQLWITWITNDGSHPVDPIFHFIVVGKLSPAYHEYRYPENEWTRTEQDE